MAISMQNTLTSSFLQSHATHHAIPIAAINPAASRTAIPGRCTTTPLFTTAAMASSPSPRPGSSLSFHAPPSGSTCIGSRRESSKHGDPASLSASPLNRVEENIGRLSAESFMTQRCTGGGHPRHSSTLTLASASFADNAGPSSPDEVPVRIGSSIASKFTPEKARLLRQKMRESESYHDRMYHSGLASRLA